MTRLLPLLLLAATTLPAQTTTAPTMPDILYGVAYYHEYMPLGPNGEDRLDKDIALMKQANVSH